jgi:hypothetical protein
MSREAMQQALYALEMKLKFPSTGTARYAMSCARDELRAELAKPEPEPVGWANSAHNFSSKYSTFVVAYHKSTGWDIPLYRKEGV